MTLSIPILLIFWYVPDGSAWMTTKKVFLYQVRGNQIFQNISLWLCLLFQAPVPNLKKKRCIVNKLKQVIICIFNPYYYRGEIAWQPSS